MNMYIYTILYDSVRMYNIYVWNCTPKELFSEAGFCLDFCMLDNEFCCPM